MSKREPIRDEWGTPRAVLERFYPVAFGHRDRCPTLDVCAAEDGWNAKCENYYYKGKAGCGLRWAWNRWPQTFFMNPPHSNVLPWIDKAIEEVRLGAVGLVLLPMDPSTKWFRRTVLFASRVYIVINGRIQFESPPDVKPSTNRAGSLFAVFEKPKAQTAAVVMAAATHYWSLKTGQVFLASPINLQREEQR